MTNAECLSQGRALEEIDALFDQPYNPFRRDQVRFSDAERQVGKLEGGQEASKDENELNARDSKPDVTHA